MFHKNLYNSHSYYFEYLSFQRTKAETLGLLFVTIEKINYREVFLRKNKQKFAKHEMGEKRKGIGHKL